MAAMTRTMADFPGLALATLLLICVLAIAFSVTSKRQKCRHPAVFDLIRRMTDEDQIYFQRLATTKGKIGAIKELRARFPVSLGVGKDTIELLDSVRPALLKLV